MAKDNLVLELMSELTKKNTQSKKIQQLCDQLNIPFKGDLVELMTFVLGSGVISQNLKNNTQTKKKNSHDINI